MTRPEGGHAAERSCAPSGTGRGMMVGVSDSASGPTSAAAPPAEVWDAAEQLYALPPTDFVARRTELVADARQAGGADAAKQIAALRKPTVSAWTVNTLSRTRPELIEDLLTLGEQMRHAQRTMDGSGLRELSKQRRQLLDALTREAFAATGQQPGASVQDEVVATLAAALADADVGQAVQAGTLVRAARADGFGVEARPELALVGPPPAVRHRAEVAGRERDAADRERDAADLEREAAVAAQRRQAERDAELAAERSRLVRVIATARANVEKVHRSEQVKADRLGDLERQLAAARQSLDETRFALRRASAELADAEQALAELDK